MDIRYTDGQIHPKYLAQRCFIKYSLLALASAFPSKIEGFGESTIIYSDFFFLALIWVYDFLKKVVLVKATIAPISLLRCEKVVCSCELAWHLSFQPANGRSDVRVGRCMYSPDNLN